MALPGYPARSRMKLYRHGVLLRPCVTEIDRITALGRLKKRRYALLEEGRLNEESFACALCVARNFDLELIDEGLFEVGHVLDLDVRDFSRAHAFFNHVAQPLFAFCLRGFVIQLLLICAQVSGILYSHVAFKRTVIQKTQLSRP